MTEPRRLFDCLQYNLDRKPLTDMIAGKENGKWKTYSTQQVKEIVDKLSAGLLNIGLSGNDMSTEGRDKIAILSKDRPEWMFLDLAVQQIGCILTPLYPTVGVNDLEFVLNDAQVKVVFVNDEELYHKVYSIKNRVPSIREIFTFEHVANTRHWKELINSATPEALQRIPGIADKIQYEDLATIIYTSGTTGTPKGVMLSHRNILSNVIACVPCFPPGENMRCLSILPLNHILERMVTYLYLFRGVSIYYAESFETLGENIREIKPHMFTLVPRILERVYESIMQKGSDLKGVKKKLFFWAHGLAEKFEINKPLGSAYKFQLALASKIIFKKWREGIGGNIRCIVSGGAACQVRLIRIFTAAQIPIMEGYGLTETSPVIAVNRFNEKERMFGTVGPLIEDVEVKIAEDGEILCKGPNVMMGYYKRPDLTAEAIINEWFYTGDIGMLVDERGNKSTYANGNDAKTGKGNKLFLKITDRKKELFKTSGGKYVAPLPIENKIKESMLIDQVMVVGSERKFVGALIVPSFPNLKKWAVLNGIGATTNDQLIKNDKVIEMYKELVESYNKDFNHVEQIKKFELLSYDWSVDTGELSPKLNLKRKVITEKYRDSIERIYK